MTQDFEVRKARWTGDPAPIEEGWQAEVAMRLNKALVVDLTKAAVNAELDDIEPVAIGQLGKVKLLAELTDVELSKARCDACIGLKGTLEGKARFKVGQVKRDVPWKVRFKGQLEFETVEVHGRRHLTMSLRQLQDLEVELASFEGQIGPGLKKELKELLKKVDAVDLGPVESEGLPLRDVRVLGDERGVTIEGLASCVDPAGAELPEWGASRFALSVSEGVLLDTARREALAYGDVSGEHALNIHVEPTSLDVDGERFTMGLRLWRLEGKGWWRDYTLEGPLTVNRGVLRMKAETAEEGDKSPGAALVDPLAWLGEGFIMDTMTDAAQGGFSTRESFGVGDARLTTTLSGVEGVDDVLLMRGQALLK